jgi:DNA-binding LacI/PurR family transcriptional regulator
VQEPQESFEFLSQGQRRNRGFLRAAGLAEDAVPVVLTRNDVAGSRKALHDVLARTPRPTAVFAHHDVLAAGLLLEARRLGVRVPEELAVVGFDDGSIAEATGLTTVRQPFEESGRIGARLLGDLLGGTSESRQHIVLGLELVVREST